MDSSFVTRTLARSAEHVPGLRRLPAAKLLAMAEIGVLAREHMQRLTPEERRRLLALVRAGRGRPSNLSRREHDELTALVAQLEPRLFAGTAADLLSPVPLPKRVTQGSRRARRARDH